MKHLLAILAICCGTMLLFTSASVWEGSATMSRFGEFPSSGYYGASNSFPRNTLVDVTNPRTGRSAAVLVVKRVDDSGVFMLLSPEAASAIGMSQNDVARVQVSLAAPGGRLVQAYPDELPYHPDPDVNPQAQRSRFAAPAEESVVELLPPEEPEETAPPTQPLPEEGPPAETPAPQPEEKDLEPRKAEPPKPSTEKVAGEIRVAMKPQPRASEEQIPPQEPAMDPIDAFVEQAAARTPQKRLHYPPREDPQFALVDIPDASRISEPMRLGRLPEARVQPDEQPTVDAWAAPSPEKPEPVEARPVLPPEPPNLVVEQVEGPEVSERMAEAPRPETEIAAAATPPELPADATEAETIPSNGIPKPGETDLALEPAELRPPVAPAPDASSSTAYAGPEERAAGDVPLYEPAAPSREPARVAEVPDVTPAERPEATKRATAPEPAEVPTPPPGAETGEKDLAEIIAELERATAPPQAERPEAARPVPEKVRAKAPAPAYLAGAATIDRLRPGSYYLQIGVFSSERNVAAAAKAFEGTYPVAVLPEVDTARRLYKVFVGPLREDEGGAMLYLARSKGYRDAFLRIGR